MNLIHPSVEKWNSDERISHVARCARVCYASKTDNELSNLKLYQSLEDKGHTSMFRHESHYYIIYRNNDKKFYKNLYNELVKYTYCDYFSYIHDKGILYIATNGDFYRNKRFNKLNRLIEDYEVCKEIFESHEIGFLLLRHTFCVITQISTSRELNRTSPNNIAEQSTRYVNFDKKGGITICLPHWWNEASWFKKTIHMLYWKGSEIMYNFLLKIGFKPQDARGVLPLDTATKCVYTYSVNEWDHILDLRLRGKTGKPHPNAVIIAEQINQSLQEYGYDFNKLLINF